jgi:CheY-like chemotaxis protein
MSQVLIVDDEPLLREELAESLELEGFTVSTAESVPDALSKLDGAQFDTVVTDLKMPKIGGLELVRRLNEDNFPGIVVVVSGHGAQSSRDEAMSLGAHACFAKPLDVDELIELLGSPE